MAFSPLSEDEKRLIYSYLDNRGPKTLSCLARELDVNYHTLLKLNALRYEDPQEEEEEEEEVSKTTKRNLRRSSYTKEEKMQILAAIHNWGSKPLTSVAYEFEGHFYNVNRKKYSDNIINFASVPSDLIDSSDRYLLTPKRRVNKRKANDDDPTSSSQESSSSSSSSYTPQILTTGDVNSFGKSYVTSDVRYSGTNLGGHPVRSGIGDDDALAIVRSFTNGDFSSTGYTFMNAEVFPITHSWQNSDSEIETSDSREMDLEEEVIATGIHFCEVSSEVVVGNDGKAINVCLSNQDPLSGTSTPQDTKIFDICTRGNNNGEYLPNAVTVIEIPECNQSNGYAVNCDKIHEFVNCAGSCAQNQQKTDGAIAGLFLNNDGAAVTYTCKSLENEATTTSPCVLRNDPVGKCGEIYCHVGIGEDNFQSRIRQNLFHDLVQNPDKNYCDNSDNINLTTIENSYKKIAENTDQKNFTENPDNNLSVGKNLPENPDKLPENSNKNLSGNLDKHIPLNPDINLSAGKNLLLLENKDKYIPENPVRLRIKGDQESCEGDQDHIIEDLSSDLWTELMKLNLNFIPYDNLEKDIE